MAKVFAINGRWYNVLIAADGAVKREISILDGENAGRMKSGGMTLDTIGTYYNYTIEISRDPDHFSDYDELHKTLRDPVARKKLLTVPFDQSYITYEAYIANISDVLIRIKDGKNYWNGMSIKFTAIDPNEVT